MKKIIIKQRCSSSSSSWSDLGVNLLREINKKLWYYADHIRFRGVCKTWRAVGHDERAAYYVLPWLMTLHEDTDNSNKLCYKLYEPPPPSQVELLEYSSIESNTSAVISGTINLGDYFNHISNPDDIVYLTMYVNGWLHITVYNYKSKTTSFLFFSLATKSSFTLPQLNVSAFPMYLALSATPDSPDCVFLALNIIDDLTRTIGIFRHGDTHWTTTLSDRGWFGEPLVWNAVFIRGVFYFLTAFGIGSYDLATGIPKVNSTLLQFYRIQHFFGLDGDLMLVYIEKETRNLCIKKYDWLNKVWVPLQSLGGRSLYLSRSSVYVDESNYYGISSANKIYVQEGGTSYVCEHSILEDGQLSTRPRFRSWGTKPAGSYIQLAIWVDLLKIVKAF